MSNASRLFNVVTGSAKKSFIRTDRFNRSIDIWICYCTEKLSLAVSQTGTIGVAEIGSCR